MNLIKKSLLTLIVTLASQAAFATSVHPCTPKVKAMPMRIQCLQEGIRYSILIETLKSIPSKMCQGENYFESQTAKVEISSVASKLPLGQVNLFDGTFNVNFTADGLVTFKSEIIGLELNNCVAPQHGGAFSIGN